ncbi:MAG: tetratricopeptide repeat protein [Gammaproteobacteria bacterium]|nr:tetratricopeptide repeat protein [Gammaproteobacteria bacterium]
MKTWLGAALLCAAAAGCTTSPYRFPSPQPSSRAPSPQPSSPSSPRPEVQEREPSPASVALLERSRADRDAGDYAAAAASLERALRIDPNNALLWIELAEVKAADGDRDQARQMARKALTLAGSDGSIEARARRLL